ncbi:MAG: hypothetical protein HZC55_18100 [Verrucomicrobia bacterium]|nr:hypothetical protein [Verrucomicrobiota bacterium]
MSLPCLPCRRRHLPVLTIGLVASLLPALPAQTAPAAPTTTNRDDIVQLSPFQVTASTDRGYHASSTMSGTRLNSKIEDLAASISVVTKQQLLDTAAVDINDVFMYESNTEGIYQWTSFTVDRGNVSDDVSANPQGATRIRGLTSANIAVGSFGTTLPIDMYNVDAVEISRGPNSSIFGLGNTGGGVNIIAAKAILGRESTTFTTRADSYGGYRGSLDLNRNLLDQRLALRLMGLYEEKGFVREPSADETRRLQAALTFRPFRSTTLRASFESYRNFNSRPNSTTPRDMVSDWRASGSPTWNPLTQMVRLADGTTIGPVTTANEATLLPYGIAATDTGFTGRPSWYIDGGQVQLYTINRMPGSTGTGPQNIDGTLRLLQNGTFYTRYSATYPLFLTKGITDKSLYDWTSVNMAAPNYSWIKGETASVELEQFFLDTPRQKLALQAAWLKERTGTNSRSFLGQTDGGRMQVFIDINEYLLDGTRNPYFLRPYVGGSEPAFRKARNNNENYRGTLAYELNLTREGGLLRWLGRNRFAGYAEYREIYGGSLGYKDTISSTEAWINSTASNFSRNGASYRVYPRYFVGDAVGQNVDYAPTRTSAPTGDYTLRYYNGVTQQWINEPVTFSEYYYANRLNRRLLSTQGGVWQGFFWNDRIIPTAGYRKDFNRTRDGNSAGAPSATTNGFYDMTPMYSFGQYDWVAQRGKTDTQGIVVKALSWLSVHYNQANSFTPGSLAYDVYGQPLPDPQGETKDYGFQLNLFNNRLTIRATQYETLDTGRGSSEINTLVQRAIRLDADGNGSGGDPDLESFLVTELAKSNPSLTGTALEAEVQRLMGVDPNFIDSHRNRTHGDGSDQASRGKEIEITANPSRFWTVRGSVTQTQAFNAAMSPKLQEYINRRYSVWTSIRSPFDGSSYWNGNYRVGNLTPQAWYLQNLIAGTKLAVANQGKKKSQVREWKANFVTNFKLAGLTDHQWLKPLDVGGAVRWEDKASIGYFGATPDADGILRELDPNRPVYDKARYYFDLMAGYDLRFFQGRVRSRVQLNVRNVLEDGRLQPIAVNPDGTPWAFRIVDPRQFILSVTFSL